MTDNERREAARQFYQRWVNRGREDEDARSYWIEFLQNIVGMDRATERVDLDLYDPLTMPPDCPGQ